MDILIESIEQGRATSTMMGVPKWMTESAIPVGFAVLLMQTVVEAVRVVTGRTGDAREPGPEGV